MGIRRRSTQDGFTIPELIVVVAIIALLGVISIFILKPDSQDVARRNAERQTNLALIAQALGNYRDKTGALPQDITTTTKAIGTDSGQIDLCKILVPNYMSDLPMDPAFGKVAIVGACNAEGQEYVSGYTVERSTDSNSVTLRAPDAEDNVTITLSKKF